MDREKGRGLTSLARKTRQKLKKVIERKGKKNEKRVRAWWGRKKDLAGAKEKSRTGGGDISGVHKAQKKAKKKPRRDPGT